jgi:hypothetical protein
MFPGTNYVEVSRKEGALFTKSGLPLKGLLLPNVESIQVLGKESDKLAKVFDIERAVDRHLLIHRLDRNPGNRFLIKALNRLNQYAINGQSAKFDTLSKILEKHSIAFRITCLFRVENTWYKKLTAKRVAKCWWKVNRLAQKNADDYRYIHVEIDKEDGSKRPLSVPPLHWRVWSNMKYTLTWIWMRNHGYPAWNHGGIAERGVNSCWKYLWLNVLSKKYANIYEYDLSKFFDKIRHSVILEALAEADMPPRLSTWCMRSLQNSKGKVPKDVRAKLLDVRLGLPNTLERVWDRISDRTLTEMEKDACSGVPQGYSLSPILACLGKGYAFTKPKSLLRLYMKVTYGREPWYKDMVEQWSHLLSPVFAKRIIAYMDDGILFGNKYLNETAIERFKKAMAFVGSPVNEKKSKWLRRDGKWLVDSFKFLGVEYFPETNWIRAKTRNGATMEFPAADLSKSIDLRGPSGRVFAQYLKGHSAITTSIKWGIFDSVLARMWSDGAIPKLSQAQFDLVSHPMSFVSYYREYWYETGPKGPRTPFTVTNASSRASRMLHSAHKNIAQRSRVKRLASKAS